ncbi:MAG: S9 family peptidase [Bacteroidota bacterium]
MPTAFARRVPCLGALLLLFAVAAPAALAQSADPVPDDVLTPLDVARIQTVGAVAVSPDGEQVAYTVTVQRDPFEANARPYSELHLYSVESGQTTGLRTGAVSHGSLTWTPDGERVSFLTRHNDDTRPALYTMDPFTGEMTRVLAFDGGIGSPAWSPDGSRVAFISAEPTAERSEVLPYQPDIYEEETPNRKLFVATLGTDAEPQMMDVPGTVYTIDWSADGTRIAAAIAPDPYVDNSYMGKRVHVLDAATGEVVARVENPGKLGAVAWSPSGEHLAMISAADVNDPKEGRLMVADASTGRFRDVLPNFEGHVTGMMWEDAETIRYSADQGVETAIRRVDRDGSLEVELLPFGEAVFTGFAASDDGEVMAFAASSPTYPTELHVVTGGEVERVTESNPWLAGKRLARQEVITYEARDGMEIEGLLIHALGHGDGDRVPLITVVHGGPEAHYRNNWLTAYSLPGQMAAAKGYAVFYPNYRGSTGRGVAFSKAGQADPAGAEFDDIVDGVDHLIAEGIVDESKVGVTGGSYGGYATGWMATRYSERFAAGVMFVGISNKVSKVGTTDIPNEEFLVHARKRPWDDWQFFLERSPIYYAEQGRTPLLIMHGADDPRVHPTQSMELYRHLKLHGEAPVRLVFYPGEGHGNRNATARFDYTLRAMRWFDHYLMGPGGDPPSYDVSDLAESEHETMKDAMGSN